MTRFLSVTYGEVMTNRLAGSRSIYLRQHADQPVDWWPWSSGAFIAARQRGVPILLSIGYAACHWCHVMSRESFSDPVTAAFINTNFVAIKVDRQQRPDIDATYMAAAQAMTGSGGWPLTVFLTPDGQPFYAGTYYPPTPRAGMPSLIQVLRTIVSNWETNGEQLAEAGSRMMRQLATAVGGLAAATVDEERLDQARDTMLADFDTENGGFGTAPKFPPILILEFLLRNAERTGNGAALTAVRTTLEKMASGGIYDQLTGGFSRYSVDERWHVPHFEKMLTDNAQLLRLYAHFARRTSHQLATAITVEVAEFLLRELLLPDGTFAAGLDAEAAGQEGASYTWNLSQLHTAVGNDNYDAALRLFGLSGTTGPDTSQVLQRPPAATDPQTIKHLTDMLRAARARRAQPARDDIVVLAANAMAITALAEAGVAAGRTAWVDAADRACESLIRVHRTSNGWLHSSLHGQADSFPATLADHASMITALAALYQATGHPGRLKLAIKSSYEMLAQFQSDDGHWFDTPAASSGAGAATGFGSGFGAPLPQRPQELTESATPAGMSAAAEALLTVAALSHTADFRRAAEGALMRAGQLITRYPQVAGWYAAVAEAMVAGPVQIAIVGATPAARAELLMAARKAAPAGSVIDYGVADEPGRPLLTQHSHASKPAAYICRSFVCERPIFAADMLSQRWPLLSAAAADTVAVDGAAAAGTRHK